MIRDEEFANRVIDQAFELWITPAVERRQAAGDLPKPLKLQSAQVLFPPDGGFRVRINDEVRGYAHARARRAVEAGDPIYEGDLGEIAFFDLGDEDLDHGHVTMLRSGEGWFVAFNFLSRRATVGSIVQRANEFLDAARSCQAAGNMAPAVDALFSACELASRARLMLHQLPAASSKTHGPVASAINRERKLGNVASEFVALFNRLSSLRPAARYEVSEHHDLSVTDAELAVVVTEIALLQDLCIGGAARAIRNEHPGDHELTRRTR